MFHTSHPSRVWQPPQPPDILPTVTLCWVIMCLRTNNRPCDCSLFAVILVNGPDGIFASGKFPSCFGDLPNLLLKEEKALGAGSIPEGGQEACLGFPRRLPCWLPLQTTSTPGFPGAVPPARGAGLGGRALPRSLPAALSDGSVTAALQRVRGWVGGGSRGGGGRHSVPSGLDFWAPRGTIPPPFLCFQRKALASILTLALREKLWIWMMDLGTPRPRGMLVASPQSRLARSCRAGLPGTALT